MKKILMLSFLLLSACNEFMCEFKDPNKMSDNELKICGGYFSKDEVVIMK